MTGSRWFPERIEGRHVLIGLLAFFGVMLIANGFFLYYALGTFNGFETSDAYRKGLRYNERIAAAEAQSARGWQPALRYERAARRLVLEVRDRNGHGVSGLAVSARIGRPVTDGSDRTLALSETAPALYSADVDLEPGQWTVRARLSREASEAVHRHKERLWVEQAQ